MRKTGPADSQIQISLPTAKTPPIPSFSDKSIAAFPSISGLTCSSNTPSVLPGVNRLKRLI